MAISSITATGDFTETNNCGSIPAAGGNCTVHVVFTPTAVGTQNGSLSLSDNVSTNPQTVSLTGIGVAAGLAVSVSPGSLTFSSQSVGTTSGAQAVTLTNTGDGTLSIASLAVTGSNASDFAQTNNCGSTLSAGANCTVNITFTPSASGSRTAALSIADDASGSPHAVSLSGTGTSTGVGSTTTSAANLSSASLDFGSEPVEMSSSPQSITLTNGGTTTLNITSFDINGADADDFAQNNTCGSSLAAGAKCSIVVLFTPSAAGTRTAKLTISGDRSGNPQTVSLSGTGSHDVILSWTPSTSSSVTGYDVYRGTTSGGEASTPLNSSPITATHYTDTNVRSGTTYYYTVASVVGNSARSTASGETVATIP